LTPPNKDSDERFPGPLTVIDCRQPSALHHAPCCRPTPQCPPLPSFLCPLPPPVGGLISKTMAKKAARAATRTATRRATRTATRTATTARSILCIYNNYESLYLVASTTEVFYARAWTSEVFYPKFNGSYRDVKAREVFNEVRDLIRSCLP